jgi:methionine sulfoxide reductase heme-binding subunit
MVNIRPLMTKTLHSWPLFWLLALVESVAIAARLPVADFRSVHGMEPIILHSVRCALPLFVLAFTASSLVTLWPSRVTRWLLSNRQYIGLAFAFGMAWHFGLVGYAIFSFGNPLNARATALDLTGLTFLLLMTLTSFRWAARRLTPANWRRLHKTGIYAIWFVATYIYLGNVRHGGDRLHYIILGVLLAAGLLRVAAWMKQRIPHPAVPAPTAVGGSPRSSR